MKLRGRVTQTILVLMKKIEAKKGSQHKREIEIYPMENKRGNMCTYICYINML